MNIFTFITITYNHEEYILEHLESIKYQIVKFGKDFVFQLIIADDCSQDKTLEYVRYWISQNEELFCEVNIISDSINRGTCYNYTKVWDLVKGHYCKTCAGDDVYSCNNLFSFYRELKENELMAGIPLTLIDGRIFKPKANIFHILASDVLYKNKDFYIRQEKISAINTPNTIIPVKCYKNPRLFEFVRKFRVTEDFPLFIKMAEEYRPLKFIQIPDVFIYYRRTKNSTYIIKNNIFNEDKIDLYQYLLSKSTSSKDKFMLKNRLSCFEKDNRFLKRVLNLNYYAYAIKLLLHIISAAKAYLRVDLNIVQHQQHVEIIRDNAKNVQASYDISKI